MGPLFIALPGVYYSLQPRLVRRSSFATSNQ
jgi:hypothetical protein